MIQEKTQKPLGHAKTLALGLLLAGLMSASTMLAAKPAYAKDFTVTNTNDSGAGSLRQAITDANASPGADAIKFNIPGSGVKTITPASPGLPLVTEAVTIDGYSQPGSSPNTLAQGTNAVIRIELDGSNRGARGGLEITADNVVVKGLAINRFFASGIVTLGSNTKVEGNFLGTDASGTVAQGNRDGVVVSGRNGTSNTVGGTSPDKRNLISGNQGSGVALQSDAQNNRVTGNLIGTDKLGTGALGNDGVFGGVAIRDSSRNTIGGSAAEANVIAFNKGDGVTIRSFDNFQADSGNSIRFNSIFSNGDLGIDLNGDGPTANDPKDPDAGPNDLQNTPVLTSATATSIQGGLNSTPNSSFVVQFFSMPSGEDEGKTFLGQTTVATNANGDASFTFAPSQAVPGGQSVTATATNSSSNTSEFSEPVAVEDENKAPVATNDAFKAKPGKTLNVPAPGVLKNDSDPDSDRLTAQLVSGPAKGTLTLNTDGSFSYKPSVKKGTDSFTYRVSDGKGGTDEAKATIKIGKKKR